KLAFFSCWTRWYISSVSWFVSIYDQRSIQPIQTAMIDPPVSTVNLDHISSKKAMALIVRSSPTMALGGTRTGLVECPLRGSSTLPSPAGSCCEVGSSSRPERYDRLLEESPLYSAWTGCEDPSSDPYPWSGLIFPKDDLGTPWTFGHFTEIKSKKRKNWLSFALLKISRRQLEYGGQEDSSDHDRATEGQEVIGKLARLYGMLITLQSSVPLIVPLAIGFDRAMDP
ncbi:unnamed protein product, partial [Nesidiocoris tenuis]